MGKILSIRSKTSIYASILIKVISVDPWHATIVAERLIVKLSLCVWTNTVFSNNDSNIQTECLYNFTEAFIQILIKRLRKVNLLI